MFSVVADLLNISSGSFKSLLDQLCNFVSLNNVVKKFLLNLFE